MREAARCTFCLLWAGAALAQTRPNVLVILADDWSYPHASAYGDPVVATPEFDRIAREGVLFRRAFAPAPSCTASRSAMLSGQRMWRLEQGATLWSGFPAHVATYPDLLEAAGYVVGYTGKGWGPGRWQLSRRPRNPAGKWSASLAAFLDRVGAQESFCFLLGSENPHRPYTPGSGAAAGLDPAAVVVPPGLPDDPVVRGDLLDYYAEVQAFDGEIGRARAELESRGLLDDTLVVVTSDHGYPFPRGKNQLYDTGTRVPMAVRWGARMPGGRVVDDFLDLSDLAPTFLEAAGAPVPAAMTGRTLLPVLTSPRSGQVDPTRDHVVLGRERHAPATRCLLWGYPVRGIRTAGHLYLENLEPDRWPAGDPDPEVAYLGRPYSEIDVGPSLTLLLQSPTPPVLAPLVALNFFRRPARELYDLAADPGQLVNVVDDPAYATVRAQLTSRLLADRTATADPRLAAGPAAFDWYTCYNPAVPRTSLWTDVEQASVSAPVGAHQSMWLAAGARNAGRSYAMFGSASGTLPGTWFGPVLVPLNADGYTAVTAQPQSPLLTGGAGVLDPAGRGRVGWQLPPFALPAALHGMVLHHAFVVLDGQLAQAVFASQPCAVTLLP